MEAIIKIGEYNICCGCGKVRITCSLDEDDLPLCEACGEADEMKKQYTKREIAQAYILKNRSLAIEDRLTLQEIADKSGIALSQVCYIYSDMAEADAKGM